MSIRKEQGPSVAQLHAQQLAQTMFADMMASSGVSHNRMAVELLYFVPKQFRDSYIQLFRKALKGDDSDVAESGRRNDSVGQLGKSAGKNTATGTESDGGTRRTEFASGQTASISGRGKKYKRYWTIEDERAFELKELVDKRLRRLAAEIQNKLDEWELADSGETRMGRELRTAREQGRVVESRAIIPDAERFREGQRILDHKD